MAKSRATCVLVALSVLVAGTALAQDRDAIGRFGSADPQPGDKAPDFRLPELGGPQHNLGDLLTQPVVVEFGAYSLPATHERQEIEALRNEFAGKARFVLIMTDEPNAGRWFGTHDFTDVSRASSERAALAERLRSEVSVGSLILLDASGETLRRYGRVQGSVFVIAPDGRVLYKESRASAEGIRLALQRMDESGLSVKADPEGDEPKANPGEGEENDGGRMGEGDGDGDAGRGPRGGVEEIVAARTEQAAEIEDAIRALPRSSRKNILASKYQQAVKAGEESREAYEKAQAGDWSQGRTAYQKWNEYTEGLNEIAEALGMEPIEDEMPGMGGRGGGRGGRGGGRGGRGGR